MLRSPDSDDLIASLTKTHNSFETPCGSYAHFKLTRYLLRVTGDSRYGDSMERVMYNTVLGAKLMRADGRAFYYADYNVSGTKVYSNHRFPCCSGTLPQVAADYRINTYFRDARGVYVNLYLPSSVRWIQDGVKVSLTQSGDYPFADSISFELTASHAKEFALNLRIPEWAQDARIEVNGNRWPGSPAPATFATIFRQWRGDDHVDLQLPRKMRLESIHPKHPDTVALLCGPLVLFALHHESGPSVVTRRSVVGRQADRGATLEAGAVHGSVKLLPFIAINDEPYSTYLDVT